MRLLGGEGKQVNWCINLYAASSLNWSLSHPNFALTDHLQETLPLYTRTSLKNYEDDKQHLLELRFWFLRIAHCKGIRGFKENFLPKIIQDVQRNRLLCRLFWVHHTYKLHSYGHILGLLCHSLLLLKCMFSRRNNGVVGISRGDLQAQWQVPHLAA